MLPNWWYKGKLVNMNNPKRIIAVVSLCLLFIQTQSMAPEPNEAAVYVPSVKAAAIVCKGLIDDDLFQSIRRRTEIALDSGAEYRIYEISTDGGLVSSADDISK